MPIVTFAPNRGVVDVPVGTPLLDVARTLGIPVELPCGGKGTCKKCLVEIEGKVADANAPIGYALLCRAHVADVPVTVRLLSDVTDEQGKFTDALEDLRLVDPALLPTPEQISPIVTTSEITVAAPQMGDGLSDYDRFCNAMTKHCDGGQVCMALREARSLPDVLRPDGETNVDAALSVAYVREDETIRIIDITQAPEQLYGLAIDIGTTTIAVQCVDMGTGHVVASKTDYNGQIRCGMDVISRINYARTPQRRTELQECVLETINGMIGDLTGSLHIDRQRIYNVTIAANTTMVHLLLGINPEYIRLEPYTPALFAVPMFGAADIGLEVHPNAPVYFAPSVGSYVGGDIVSGLLGTGISLAEDQVSMFLDIGTNGELLLGNAEFMIACACSAGPAFEGGDISSGMRASEGAIERVEVDKATGMCELSVIGNATPVGICGSGMISLVASLFETGWIDQAGRLNRDKSCSAIRVDGKMAFYRLTESISINEADIQNLIRAKAAIFSACCTLLANVGLTFDDLHTIYIAGGFGRYLDIDMAVTIGLLPALPAERYVFLGNASLSGAYMALLSSTHRQRLQGIAQQITYVDLSTEPGYMDQYVAALFLPHTDAGLFKRI